MTYRRTRREAGFLNSLVSRFEEPSKVFDHIRLWHPEGPWSVGVYTPKRKLVARKYFDRDELAAMQSWLCEFQSQFPRIQWFTESGRDAIRRRNYELSNPPPSV
jgi:hypothetical protein